MAITLEIEREEEKLSEITLALNARKRLRGIENYVPNKRQMEGHLSKCRTVLYCGGNRAGKCVGKDFKIFDPILGKEIEVGKIKSDFHVLAFDGTGLRVAKAERPFRKEKDKIYEVKLSNGGKFTCSMSHVVLTPFGFRTISDVSEGDELFLPQTILASSLSTHGEGGRSFYQKAEGSQFDYRSLLHLCGEQLQMGEDSAQDVVPSRDDVQERMSSENLLHKDDQNNKSFYIRPYSFEPLLSNSDDLHQTAGQFVDTLSETSCTTLQSVDLSISVVPKSIDVSFLQQSTSSKTQYPKLDDSIHPSDTSCAVRVISISYLRIDYKWDFTVPIYHNYFGNGCVHHNSTFGAAEICYAMTKLYPDWYPQKKRFYGPVRGVASGTSFGVVMRVIEPKLNSLLPPGSYTVKKTAQGFPSQYKFKDGSILDILTLEMDLMAYQGADWDIAWLDEPQSKIKFLGIQRGLVDRRGRCIITFTPLTEPWMKEDIADRADGVSIDLITVDIRENMRTVDGSTILSEESISEFEKTLPEDFKETMLHGKFFHLRGAIYQELCDEHIKTFEYDKRSPVICVLDPHDRVPHHVIWAWIDRDDDIYVDYEWEGHVELPDLSNVILKIEKERGYNMKRRLIDPNFGRKPARVGISINVMQELRRAGCAFYEANDNIELGHMMVRDYLHFNKKKEVSATNKPKLFFNRERCSKTIRSVRNLQYEDWSGKTADNKDPKEVEKDKENHGADCVRYLVISRPKYGQKSPSADLTESPY